MGRIPPATGGRQLPGGGEGAARSLPLSGGRRPPGPDYQLLGHREMEDDIWRGQKEGSIDVGLHRDKIFASRVERFCFVLLCLNLGPFGPFGPLQEVIGPLQG